MAMEVPTYCFFQGCYNPEFEKQMQKAKGLCYEYNRLNPNDRKAQSALLKKILKRVYEDTVIVPPFWCDYCKHITVGKSFYANHNMVIQDGAQVIFGDHVFIGPNCCFTTAEHAIDPDMRKSGMEVAKPITVGNNVWIGAGSTVLAGVTIGDNSVIGAGSVVKKDIPANVVAVGVPCRVIRKIDEQDRYRYPAAPSYEKQASLK